MAGTEKLEQAANGVVARYPKTVTLRDGRSVELRLMTEADAAAVLNFARSLNPDDLLFLRSNITEEPAVRAWAANVAAGRTLTVLAWDGEKVAGYASLHLNEANWMRHLAEIRMLAGSAYRGTGLGRILAHEMYRAGRDLGLKRLSAQMTLDQPGARATFERLGFKAEALLTDWVMARDGRTRDLLVMAYDLEGFTDTVDV